MVCTGSPLLLSLCKQTGNIRSAPRFLFFCFAHRYCLPHFKIVKIKKMNTTKNVLFAAATGLALLVASPFNSKANNGKEKGVKEAVAPWADGKLSVQYTGSTEDGVMFNVKFENTGAEKFWLIIKNNEGDVLFQAQFSDVHFNKNIQFLRDGDNVNPTFIVRSGKQEIKHTFVVNRTLVENVVVTKL